MGSLPQKRVRFTDDSSQGHAAGSAAEEASRDEHGGAALSQPQGSGGSSFQRAGNAQNFGASKQDSAMVAADKRQEEGVSDAARDSESAVSLRRALLAAEAEAVTSSSSDEDTPAVPEVVVLAPDNVGGNTALKSDAAPKGQHQAPPVKLAAEPILMVEDEDVKVDVGGPEDLLSLAVQPQAASAPGTVPAEAQDAAAPSPHVRRVVPSNTEDAKENAASSAAAPAPGVDALAVAAAEEERLRAEMEDEEKESARPQEPPDSPVQYSKDPWAHEAW